MANGMLARVGDWHNTPKSQDVISYYDSQQLCKAYASRCLPSSAAHFTVCVDLAAVRQSVEHLLYKFLVASNA